MENCNQLHLQLGKKNISNSNLDHINVAHIAKCCFNVIRDTFMYLPSLRVVRDDQGFHENQEGPGNKEKNELGGHRVMMMMWMIWKSLGQRRS